MSDPRPLICGTNIMRPPPRRVPILRYNAELAKILWTSAGIATGLLLSIPAWILGIYWLGITLLVIGAFAGLVCGELEYQGLPPHKAVRRRARWTLRRKLDQQGGDRAAIYSGCCGPLKHSHQAGTPIKVIPGSRPVTTPLQDLTGG